MRYFVYYQYGSCDYGDHECELKVFDTLDKAEKFAKGLPWYAGWTIIYGEVKAVKE